MHAHKWNQLKMELKFTQINLIYILSEVVKSPPEVVYFGFCVTLQFVTNGEEIFIYSW